MTRSDATPPPADAPNARPGFVLRVLERLARAQGPVRWRREDPVTCLIGTILAQATNDPLAERAYRALRRRYPTWGGVLAAPRAEVERTIRMCGLARQKAGAIRAFLRHLKETRGALKLDLRGILRRGRLLKNAGHGVPSHTIDALLADLTSVPGVGIKTAAITLMFGSGADLCAVDTHLVRILRRLRIVPEKAAPDRAFRILRPLVPPGRGIELHLQLIRHGRETCKALRPRCGACPVRGVCPSAFSVPGARSPVTLTS
jgi:endonuclease III